MFSWDNVYTIKLRQWWQWNLTIFVGDGNIDEGGNKGDAGVSCAQRNTEFFWFLHKEVINDGDVEALWCNGGVKGEIESDGNEIFVGCSQIKQREGRLDHLQ